MRFRLANTGNQLVDGVSNGAAALFSMPYARAQAEEEGQLAGMKRQLVESQVADHVAQAALRQQQLDREKQIPGVLDDVIASQAGTTVPELNRYRSYLRSGVQPTTSASGDAATDEAIGIPTQPALDPKVAQALGLQMQRMAPAMVNPKSYTVQGQAQAAGRYQQQGAIDQIVQNPGVAALYGQAYAATEGRPLVDNVGNTGVGFNRFSGQGAVIDQGLRTLFGDEVGSKVRENDAQAGSARAAAGAHGASADLARARRERVMGGYDKPVTILDDDNGEASVTRLPTGADPVTIGLAPKKKTGTDATNAKERNRVVRDVEKELVGAKDSEIQAEVDRRMARRGDAGKPASAPAAAAPPQIDMGKASQIKADVKAGKLTREQGIAQLRALGFK